MGIWGYSWGSPGLFSAHRIWDCAHSLTLWPPVSLGDFQVLSLCWHLNGDSLALLSKDHFCLCFLETEERVGTTFGRPGDHT